MDGAIILKIRSNGLTFGASTRLLWSPSLTKCIVSSGFQFNLLSPHTIAIHIPLGWRICRILSPPPQSSRILELVTTLWPSRKISKVWQNTRRPCHGSWTEKVLSPPSSTITLWPASSEQKSCRRVPQDWPRLARTAWWERNRSIQTKAGWTRRVPIAIRHAVYMCLD